MEFFTVLGTVVAMFIMISLIAILGYIAIVSIFENEEVPPMWVMLTLTGILLFVSFWVYTV